MGRYGGYEGSSRDVRPTSRRSVPRRSVPRTDMTRVGGASAGRRRSRKRYDSRERKRDRSRARKRNRPEWSEESEARQRHPQEENNPARANRVVDSPKRQRRRGGEAAEQPPPPIQFLAKGHFGASVDFRARSIAKFLSKINEPLRSALAGPKFATHFPDNWFWATLHARYCDADREFARELSDEEPEL